MTILSVLLVLAFIGFMAWCAQRFIVDGSIRSVAMVFLFICAVLVVMNAFGVLGFINQPVPRVH